MNAPKQNCLLVVDDDPKIRNLLTTYFEEEGFFVADAAHGDEMRERLGAHCFDLVLLDLMLPGDDGFHLAREIQESHRIPVIMISGRGDVTDRVVGLELGAEDYITKPFHLREVLARVRKALRRSAKSDRRRREEHSQENDEILKFDGWRLDPIGRELQGSDGGIVDLTASEFDLLLTFLKCPNRALSRDQLMDLTRGRGWTPYDRSIDTQIGRLRKKIEKDPCKPQIIKTVRGVGYIFAANVARTQLPERHAN